MTNERQLANFCDRLAKATGTPEVEEDGYFDFIVPIEQLMR